MIEFFKYKNNIPLSNSFTFTKIRNVTTIQCNKWVYLFKDTNYRIRSESDVCINWIEDNYIYLK